MWCPVIIYRLIVDTTLVCILCHFYWVGFFKVTNLLLGCTSILSLAKNLPSRSGVSYHITSTAISGLLILNIEILAQITVVSKIIQHNVHVTVWVTLRIHLRVYHISRQFSNFSIIKLYQVLSNTENGVVIGLATHLAACITFAPSDSSFRKSTSTG